MLLYLLIVSALNLAVGYGLALVVLRAKGGVAASPAPAAVETTAPPPPAAPAIAAEPAPAPFSLDELPQEWLPALQEAGEIRSLVEGSIHVLQSEAARYRDRLVEIDGVLRRCLREPQIELLIMCLGELQQANADWLEKQNQAVEVLQAKRGRHGDMNPISVGLEEILMEQTAQIETTCSNVKLLDLHSDVQAGAARLVSEVCKLLEMCHRLQDRLQESLLGVLMHGGRLMELNPQRLIDPATKIHNRLGLERMLGGWWADDPSRSRQATFALVDIDRLRRINEQWGPLIGDRLAAHVGRRIAQTLRSNRGFDVAGRLSGQTFAMFLGDTGPSNATVPLERIRQTIAAQRFLLGEQEIEVRVTCGIVEVHREDTTITLCQRAMQTLREAKRAGRNLTLLRTSTGVTVVEPPACQVRSQVVRLDEEDSSAA